MQDHLTINHPNTQSNNDWDPMASSSTLIDDANSRSSHDCLLMSSAGHAASPMTTMKGEDTCIPMPALDSATSDPNSSDDSENASPAIPTNTLPAAEQEFFVRGYWFGWRTVCILQLLMSLVILGLGTTTWIITKGNTCYHYMLHWMIGQMAISAAQFFSSLLLLCLLPSVYDLVERASQRALRTAIPFALTRFITAAFVIWQMVGISSLGLGVDDDCPSDIADGMDWIYVFSFLLLLTHCIFLLAYASIWLCIPCGFMLYYAYDEGASSDTAFFTLSNRNGASLSLIESIPVIRYDGESSVEMTCSICLTEYTSGEPVRRLPCGHLFHPNCLDPWLARNAVCPQCRSNIQESSTV